MSETPHFHTGALLPLAVGALCLLAIVALNIAFVLVAIVHQVGVSLGLVRTAPIRSFRQG